MKIVTTVLVAVAMLILLSACRSSTTPPAAASNRIQTTTAATVTQPPETTAAGYRPRIDACSLLTSSEIATIQNDQVKTTKLGGALEKGFDVSQCFFALETFANSISLKVTQKREAKDARDPKEFWRTTFRRDQGDNRERELARKQAHETFEREEEESAPPMPVTGIGDDAYWVGDQVGGALYVLKGDNYLRISIGGVGDRNAKIRKSTALAQKVLDRLSS